MNSNGLYEWPDDGTHFFFALSMLPSTEIFVDCTRFA